MVWGREGALGRDMQAAASKAAVSQVTLSVTGHCQAAPSAL